MKKWLVSSLSAACLLALPSIACADSWTSLIFAYGDNRLFSDELDWAYGAYKGECGMDVPVLAGVSAMARDLGSNPGGPGDLWSGGNDAVLCASFSNTFVNLYDTETLDIYDENLNQGSDNRLDTSTGEWAYGYWKGECAANEAVIGVSQWPNDATRSIHCAVVTNMTAPASCLPYNFDGHDGRQVPFRNQDWAPNWWKGECSPGNYVKGVAMSTGEHRQAAVILCCTPPSL
jgi:hypothetical protein